MAKCQYPRLTSGAFTVNRQASQVIMVQPCLSSWYAVERFMVGVTEEDRANHGRTALRNGQVSRCRHCCALQTIEVDVQPSQRRHRSEYPTTPLSQELVSWLDFTTPICSICSICRRLAGTMSNYAPPNSIPRLMG